MYAVGKEKEHTDLHPHSLPQERRNLNHTCHHYRRKDLVCLTPPTGPPCHAQPPCHHCPKQLILQVEVCRFGTGVPTTWEREEPFYLVLLTFPVLPTIPHQDLPSSVVLLWRWKEGLGLTDGHSPEPGHYPTPPVVYHPVLYHYPCPATSTLGSTDRPSPQPEQHLPPARSPFLVFLPWLEKKTNVVYSQTLQVDHAFPLDNVFVPLNVEKNVLQLRTLILIYNHTHYCTYSTHLYLRNTPFLLPHTTCRSLETENPSHHHWTFPRLPVSTTFGLTGAIRTITCVCSVPPVEPPFTLITIGEPTLYLNLTVFFLHTPHLLPFGRNPTYYPTTFPNGL